MSPMFAKMMVGEWTSSTMDDESDVRDDGR